MNVGHVEAGGAPYQRRRPYPLRRHWGDPMTTVMITEAPLATEQLLAVAGGARVELDDGGRA